MPTPDARPLALVTGASAGIGAATAARLAAGGHRVLLSARRTDRLAALAARLDEAHGAGTARAVALDVAAPGAHERALAELPEAWRDVDVLVANAGLARGLAPVWENTAAEVDAMLDTNVKGVLHGLRAVVPGMLARGRGHVVLLGSTAGRWVYAGGTVYCATKFAVRALAEGLKRDLQGTPLRVSLVAPGLVETEFTRTRFAGTGADLDAKDAEVYGSTRPLRPEDVAEAIAYCLAAPPHVDVFDVTITPRVQAGSDVLRGEHARGL